MIDFTKPLRFAKVQNDDHVTYQPRLVGSYIASDNTLRWVVCSRNWDSAPGFILYKQDGTLVDAELARLACNASGIMDPNLVNGPEITTHEGVINGVRVVLTFDGTVPKQVRMLT